MKMSIDNSIRLLEDYLEWLKLHNMDGTGIDGATKNLIEIAKKYQKIAQIINDWKRDGGAFEMSEPYWLRLISEVVEDDKNNGNS